MLKGMSLFNPPLHLNSLNGIKLVTVKWNKEQYTVELNTAEPPLVFKSQLFALTGVPPDRQKSMLN